MRDIEIMKDLFINRDDVYAKYYEEKGIWFPPKKKNSTQYEPLSDRAILNHIMGTHRIGAYSTDKDSTVKWITADFDDNELAYDHCLSTRGALTKHSIPSYIERSYSGKGYHLWVFFKNKLSAATARSMMLGALKEAGVPITGKFKKGSSGRSMDRLIPTQDKLPIGGLGNLVCLPLQGSAVKRGCTSFMDDSGAVLEDQMSFLESIMENGRLDIHDKAIEELSSLVKSKENASEDKLWNENIPAENIQLLRGCEAIKEGINNANIFNNFAWMGVLTNIAVFGSNGRDLAHEFSAGYDTRGTNNGSGSYYVEEDTDRVYFNKVEYIQRGGHPTSCKRIAEEGWECPLISSCTYKHIAKYGSEAEKSDHVKEIYEIYGGSQVRDKVRETVLNTSGWRTLYKDKYYMEGVWLDGVFSPYEKMADYDIDMMLSGGETQIEQFDDRSLSKFTRIEFSSDNSAEFFSTHTGGCSDSNHVVWIFHNRKENALQKSLEYHDMAVSFGLEPVSDPYIMDRWCNIVCDSAFLQSIIDK